MSVQAESGDRDEVKMRLVASGDRERLERIHADCLATPYPKEFFDTLVDGANPSFFGLVATYGPSEYVVGAVTVELQPRSRHSRTVAILLDDPAEPTDPLIAYIMSLCVVPSFRRLGLGSQLLQRISAQASALQAQVIFLHVMATNQAAISLYHRQHFQTLRSIPHYYTHEDAPLPSSSSSSAPSTSVDALELALYLNGASPPSPLRSLILRSRVFVIDTLSSIASLLFLPHLLRYVLPHSNRPQNRPLPDFSITHETV